MGITDYVWELGADDNFIKFTDKNMAKIMKALVVTEGSFTSSFLDSANTVMFKIVLDKNKRTEFEKLSGFKLTKCPEIKGQC